MRIPVRLIDRLAAHRRGLSRGLLSIFAVGTLTALLSAQPEEPSAMMTTLFKGLDFRASQLRSLDCTLTVQETAGDLARKNGLPDASQVRRYVLDGAQGDWLYEMRSFQSEHGVELIPDDLAVAKAGVLARKRLTDTDWALYERDGTPALIDELRGVVLGLTSPTKVPWEKGLRVFREEETCEVTLGGVQCYRLLLTMDKGPAPVHLALWVDSEKGFAPIQTATIVRIGGAVRYVAITRYSDLRKQSDRFWMPYAITASSWNYVDGNGWVLERASDFRVVAATMDQPVAAKLPELSVDGPLVHGPYLPALADGSLLSMEAVDGTGKAAQQQIEVCALGEQLISQKRSRPNEEETIASILALFNERLPK